MTLLFSGLLFGKCFYRKAMIVDGFISAVAALIACRLKAEVQDYCIFSHQSEEPGMRIILEELGRVLFTNENEAGRGDRSCTGISHDRLCLCYVSNLKNSKGNL